MPKLLTHRKSCRFCNSRNIKPALRYAFTPAETLVPPDTVSSDPLPLIVSVCENCKLVQQMDVVDPGRMFAGQSRIPVSTSSITTHFKAYAADAAAMAHLRPGDLVVDIGLGDRTLLHLFRDKGMKVVGVDPSLQADRPEATDGIPVYAEFFSPSLAGRILADHGPASLITSNRMFGCIDNAHAFIAGVRHLLKKDGLLFIEEPDLSSMLEGNLFDLVHHERITFPTAVSTERFLLATHMHLMDAASFPFRGGTLRMVAQRSDGPHVVSSRLGTQLAREADMKAGSLETLAAFAGRTEKLKAEIKELVESVRRGGGKIAGYGASARTQTFVQECGWQSGVLEFIIDDQPSKRDHVLAGTDIRVVSPDALMRERPGHVILFAHADADHIMGLHPEYTKAGGKFIIPFPGPRIA